ncbi:holo-ACP synthase [Halobacillus shinanisalinarum]|uniref:Holo-[acyl-carrier-protein] synthase n=1 Tax=Halobacillus shinanisalinarum TaxID=2932258 RepID=A0ABY4GUG3_9BACI|nr:holo-ACP synthase [Halobacillus shinanisalinarum]UOQ91796.1 holo-ACP synthase [Halobacillus shinanisalinarum]
MIKGIGIDIIEIDRIKQSIKRNHRFVQRILTEAEQQQYERLNERRRVEFLAGRFAAKEAFSKAVGTGIGKLSFHDIEVTSNDAGAPVVQAKGYETLTIWVAISHSKKQAVAQIVLEGRANDIIT